MRWMLFRTAEDRDVLVNMERAEAIYPGEQSDDQVELYTETGVHMTLRADIGTLNLFLEAEDHRPRAVQPPVVSLK